MEPEQPHLADHCVIISETIVGKSFGAPNGCVGCTETSEGHPAVFEVPREARTPLARFFEDEGCIWPGEVCRHVELCPFESWSIESVDVFALYRFAIAARARQGKTFKRRTRAPKLRDILKEIRGTFGCGSLPAEVNGREGCDGGLLDSLACIETVPKPDTCRVRGCAGRAVGDRAVCSHHAANRLRQGVPLAAAMGGRSLSALARRDLQHLMAPGFILGFLGSFLFENRHPDGWTGAKRRGLWLASGGILDDEARILLEQHPRIAAHEVPAVYRCLLPDGSDATHAVECKDLKQELSARFPDGAARTEAWKTMQLTGCAGGVSLRSAAWIRKELQSRTDVKCFDTALSVQQVDECTSTVDASHGFHDYEFMGGAVAVVQAEYLSWGMLMYLLKKSTTLLLVGDISKRGGFFDRDLERTLGGVWNFLLELYYLNN